MSEPTTDIGGVNPYAAPRTLEDQPDSDASKLARKQRSQARRWSAIVGVTGLAIGLVSRIIRPMIPGNIHYESIVSGILLILLCFVMLGRVIRFPYKRALVGLQLGLFGIWMGYFLGWTMIHGEIWSEFVAVSAGMWGTSAFVGFIILYIRSLQPQR